MFPVIPMFNPGRIVPDSAIDPEKKITSEYVKKATRWIIVGGILIPFGLLALAVWLIGPEHIAW